MQKPRFRDLYCQAFGCPIAGFEPRLFWHCFYPHARIPARLIWLLHRRFFADDLDLIRAAGDTHSMSQLVAEVNAFRHSGHWKGLLQGTLRVRMSGSRLLAIGAGLFTEAPRPPLPGPPPRPRPEPVGGSGG